MDGEPNDSIHLQTATTAPKKADRGKKEKKEKKKEKKERKEKGKPKEMQIAVSSTDTSLATTDVLPVTNEEVPLENNKEKKKKKKKKNKAAGEPLMDESVFDGLVLTNEEQLALAEIVQATIAGNTQQPVTGMGVKRKHDFVEAEAGTLSKRPAYAVPTSEGIHGVLPNAEASSSSAAAHLQIPMDALYMEQLAGIPEQSENESTKQKRGKGKHASISGGVGGKWLNTSELEKLGIPYKKGPFNTTEDRILKQALKDFGIVNNLDQEQMEKAIFRKRRKDTHSPSDVISSFWVGLSEKLPERPVQAIYHRVRRMYHSGNYVGKWSAEEDELLLKLVKVQGFSWESISEQVGRMGTSCRDRYREIRKRNEQHSGKWTTEEEETLREAIRLHTNRQGDISWLMVAEKVQTRNETQCRLKWVAIDKPEYQEMHKRWTLDEELTLVQNVYNSTAEEEDQVNWIEMAQLDFTGRSGPQLLKRFKGIRREIPDQASLEFTDVMEQMLERVNQKIALRKPDTNPVSENPVSEQFVANSDDEMNG